MFQHPENCKSPHKKTDSYHIPQLLPRTLNSPSHGNVGFPKVVIISLTAEVPLLPQAPNYFILSFGGSYKAGSLYTKFIYFRFCSKWNG
jgi:hypothetical protein